jgi:hypothetical protein
MKRGLLAATLLAISFTDLRAAGVDGHELLKNCSAFAASKQLTTYEQGYCLGFVSGAGDLIVLLNETVWPQKRFCQPQQGIPYNIMAELLLGFLNKHTEKRDQQGFTLLTEALAEAYPCKA